MQVKVTKNSPTKVTLSFKATEANLKPIKNAAVAKLGRDLKLPGFRQGKAPIAVIEKNLPESSLQTEVIEEAINLFYGDTVKQNDLRPVAQPEVNIKKFVPFTELEADITVEIIGAISLPDYKKIKLAKPKVAVTAADVTEVLNTLAERSADRADVDRPAKKGDQTLIDFKGTDTKGEPINGAEGKDYPLILGSNSFIPGFEDNLIGVKPGQEKTFTIAFPKDYGVAALASKKVTFAVTVQKVQELKKPKIDDDLAKQVGPFKDLKELKEDVKKQLLAERQQNADRDYQNQLLEKITAKSKVEVPDSLIEQQLDAAEREERQNLMYKGQTWEEHLKEEGVTEEEHRKRNRASAETRVKAGLVLSEISEKEKLDVTPQELDTQIALLKGQYQDAEMQAELDKPENRRDVAMRILSEKTIDKLVGYASK